jgi:hypothetical protein
MAWVLIYPGQIVGATGGLSFYPNPCIGQESTLFSNLSLYANSGYPGASYALKYKNFPLRCVASNYICLAYNYGYNSGLYAATYALDHGVVAKNWWIDVETDNSWTNTPAINIASLEGETNAIKTSTNPTLLGFYSYPADWKIITGGWRNDYPSWIATNSNFNLLAQVQCDGPSFTGGSIILAQYIKKVDTDLACPQTT